MATAMLRCTTTLDKDEEVLIDSVSLQYFSVRSQGLLKRYQTSSFFLFFSQSSLQLEEEYFTYSEKVEIED